MSMDLLEFGVPDETTPHQLVASLSLHASTYSFLHPILLLTLFFFEFVDGDVLPVIVLTVRLPCAVCKSKVESELLAQIRLSATVRSSKGIS